MKNIKSIATLIVISSFFSLTTSANTFKTNLRDILPWESLNWNNFIYVSNTTSTPTIVSINVSTSSKNGIKGTCKGNSFTIGVGASFTCISSSDVSWASTGTGTGSSYSASGTYSVTPTKNLKFKRLTKNFLKITL